MSDTQPASEVTRRFKLRGPVPGGVRVIFTDDMVRTAIKYKYTEKDARALHAFCILDYKRPLLVLARGASPEDIVHECGHVAFALLEYADIPVTYEENEAYCYVLDYIFGRVSELHRQLR